MELLINLMQSSNNIGQWIKGMTQFEFYKSFLFPIELMVAEVLFLSGMSIYGKLDAGAALANPIYLN